VGINFRAIEAYITRRREDEKSNATINRELELLRGALRLAHDRQLLPSIPKVRVLPENNTRQGFFERPDLEAVVSALPAYLQDFTRLAYLTGWRKGEIISLKWTDVDRDARAIRLRPEAAKTGRGRTVMLEGDLAELIDRRWQARLLEKDGNARIAALVFHPRREARGRLPQGVGDRLPSCRGPRQTVPRPAPHRSPEHGARGCPRTSGDGGDRPSDTQHVRPLQHRQRG